MSAINEVYKLTKQIVQLVENEINSENRDQTIEAISTLLAQREECLVDVERPSTEDQKQLANQIIKMNANIEKGMLKIRSSIQADIANHNKSKSAKTKYVNPYQSIVSDGLFYDKRK